MRLPPWLYLKREDKYLRTRRWGSRRPLRLVFTILDGGDADPFPANYILGVGPVGVQYGPADGVTAGHTSMPPGSRWHTWFFGSGRALAISWDGGGW